MLEWKYIHRCRDNNQLIYKPVARKRTKKKREHWIALFHNIILEKKLAKNTNQVLLRKPILSVKVIELFYDLAFMNSAEKTSLLC